MYRNVWWLRSVLFDHPLTRVAAYVPVGRSIQLLIVPWSVYQGLCLCPSALAAAHSTSSCTLVDSMWGHVDECDCGCVYVYTDIPVGVCVHRFALLSLSSLSTRNFSLFFWVASSPLLSYMDFSVRQQLSVHSVLPATPAPYDWPTYCMLLLYGIGFEPF